MLADFSAAKVPVGNLHFGPAALLNASLPFPLVEGEQLALVVDIGSQTTSVGLLGEHRLLACRQLSSGGQHFTDSLAQARNVTPEVAERWKVEGRIPPASGSAPTSRAFLPPKMGISEVLPLPLGNAPAPALATPPALIDHNDLFAEHQPSAVTSDFSADKVPSVGSAASGSTLFILGSNKPLSPPAPGPLTDHFSQDEALPIPPELDLASPAAFDAFQEELELNPVLPPGRATAELGRVELGPELTKAAEMLYAQLSSSIAWFKTQLNLTEIPIAKVLLSGGGGSLVALDRYLARRFGVPVERFDPFRGLKGAAPAVPHEFATALGLALAAPGGPREAVHLELMPEGVLMQRLWTQKLVWPFVAAAAVLFAGIITGWTLWAETEAASQAKIVMDQFSGKYKKLVAQISELGKEREAVGEDLRAVASRIYAARDLLHTVRALKEQTQKSKELWVTHLETKDVAKDIDAIEGGAGAKKTRAKGRIRDTAIDRGGVLISGFVKFDARRTDVELTEFFNKWFIAILEWTPESGLPRLFSARQVQRFDVQHIKEGGSVPYEVEFSYQQTDMNQVTERHDQLSLTAPLPEKPAAPLPVDVQP